MGSLFTGDSVQGVSVRQRAVYVKGTLSRVLLLKKHGLCPCGSVSRGVCQGDPLPLR